MIRCIIPLILVFTPSIRALQEVPVPVVPGLSAASESQIKLALENNYDQTGPGAKGPEYAYNTYKTLEEALVSYIDDPDTKLPDSERMKAINRLVTTPKDYERYNSEPIREYPKSVADYTGYRQIPQIAPVVIKKNTHWPHQATSILYNNPTTHMGIINQGITLANINSVTPKYATQPLYRSENIHRATPVIPGYLPYLAKVKHNHEFYDNRPQYSTQGIFDKYTKDNTAFDSSVSPVRGFYSFVDGHGNQRTIHYTAGDNPPTRAHLSQ